ncbi:gliding motility-associated C-terminal domain-containing protein [Lacihabitans sp. LS3-19]|nr:gliding motility-associated C-terminal domain-containing protein [Lacihabitans sp. LS3-19]
MFEISLFGQAYAQNLCNDPSFEKGGFDFSEASICLPKLVTLTNTSGVQNPKYVFDYQDESLETVKAIASSQNSKNFNTLKQQPEISTILQIGEKSGKITIACKNIVLRSNNSPIYSYTVCAPYTLGINIPVHELNDFDSYEITMGAIVINITKADLPYQKIQTLAFPVNIKVEGKYTDLSKSCINPSPTIQLVTPIFGPNATTSQFHPAIKKIELTSKSNASITFSGAFLDTSNDNEVYNLFAYKIGALVNLNFPNIANIKPGKYNYPITDTTSTYCFFVQRKNNICGVFSERSAEMCTHPLNSATFKPYEYDLDWEKYPNKLFGQNNVYPFSYITSTQKIIRIEATQNILEIPTLFQDKKYTDSNIDCKKKYCYQVISNVSGVYNFTPFSGQSISNQICKDRSEIIAEKLSDAWVSTSLTNTNEINFENKPNWPVDVEKFYLYKVQNGNLDIIDSLDKSQNQFIDKIPVSKSEKYSVGYQDICNSKSALVNNFSSIFLEKNASDKIIWTKESPFSLDKIGAYEVEYIDEKSDLVIDQVSLNKSVNTHIVSFDKYDSDAKFRIKAKADSTSIHESYSNTITIPVIVALFIPEVFTPNADNNNDLFELKGKTSNFDFFQLQIYNRFGEKIIELKNPTDTWDGNLQGKPAPVGLYSYKLSAIHKNGEVFSSLGALELIR